ncbi:rhombotin, putative, partial [Ixodes scapularis]
VREKRAVAGTRAVARGRGAMLFGADSMDMKSGPGRRVVQAGTLSMGPGGNGLGALGMAGLLPGPECAGCQKPIRERFLLKALDQLWHEDCLKCACCDCRLGEVGSTLFTKANLILCKRDYLRLFGTTGLCSACSKTIPAFEMVMRARGNVYHLECFACQHCNHRFCVGDRFYLFDNKILCEYDYEERLSFQNVPFPGHTPSSNANSNNGSSGGNNPSSGNPSGSRDGNASNNAGSNAGGPPTSGTSPGSNATLQRLKRHTLDHMAVQDDASSGYGSPDSLLSDGK